MSLRIAYWLATAAFLAALPLWFSSSSALTLLCQIGVAAIFAMAYNVMLGQTGMLSFGHALYFGLAGFASIHLMNASGAGMLPYIPVSLMPLLGGLFGLLVGIVIGYVSTRLSGIPFAMISLGFMELVSALAIIFPGPFYGRAAGHTDRRYGIEPLGITFGPQVEVYYLIAGWLLLVLAVLYAFTKTPLGVMCIAVRENAERVRFIGFNEQRVRWLAFSVSAFFAGLAGALHAINYEFIGAGSLGAQQSTAVLVMTYIGGTGSLFGPVAGAVLVTTMTSVLSDVTTLWPLYLGLLFVVVVVFIPGGLANIAVIHRPIWRHDRHLILGLMPSYLSAVIATAIGLTGLVGILELLSFVRNAVSWQNNIEFLGLAVPARSPWPWLVSLAMAGSGFALCRATYRWAGRAWRTANATASESFASERYLLRDPGRLG
jgi:branched-chain amino acid transport system permease protein